MYGAVVSEQARPWRQLLKGAAGFAIGLTIWLTLTPAYNRALALTARGMLAVIQREPAPEFRQKGREVLVIRPDVPARSSRPGIPLYDLTFNIVLLTTLFAVNRKTFSDVNVKGFLIAIAVLFVTHVLALTIWTRQLYVSWFGTLSANDYGDMSRLFWTRTVLFYRLVAQFAIPVLLWWLLSRERPAAANVAPRKLPRSAKR